MLTHQRLANPELASAIAKATHFVFDVDGTLVERQGRLGRSLAETLAGTSQTLCIATSRACSELDEIFEGSGFSRARLFEGHVILEDGSLILRPGKSNAELLVGSDEAKAVLDLMHHLGANISPIPGENGWGMLADIETPQVHIPCYYDYQASGSLWQRNHASLPELEPVMSWCLRAARELGVAHIVQLSEIGDGTLRVSVRGRSKGSALTELHAQGALNLGTTVYFGDGRNDLPAAQAVRLHGGRVIAANSRCEELVQLADYVTGVPGPRGVEQLLRSISNARN